MLKNTLQVCIILFSQNYLKTENTISFPFFQEITENLKIVF